MKQRKITQDSQAVYFNIHKRFLDHDHVARQAAEADKKLQNSHYDGEKKEQDWDKYMLYSKKNSTQLWRALLIMATVVLMMALKSACFSKELEALGWRQWSMLPRPSQISWSNGYEEGT